MVLPTAGRLLAGRAIGSGDEVRRPSEGAAARDCGAPERGAGMEQRDTPGHTETHTRGRDTQRGGAGRRQQSSETQESLGCIRSNESRTALKSQYGSMDGARELASPPGGKAVRLRGQAAAREQQEQRQAGRRYSARQREEGGQGTERGRTREQGNKAMSISIRTTGVGSPTAENECGQT